MFEFCDINGVIFLLNFERDQKMEETRGMAQKGITEMVSRGIMATRMVLGRIIVRVVVSSKTMDTGMTRGPLMV